MVQAGHGALDQLEDQFNGDQEKADDGGAAGAVELKDISANLPENDVEQLDKDDVKSNESQKEAAPTPDQPAAG